MAGEIDPLQLMQRVADEALELIEAADGVLVGVLIDSEALAHVCGAGHLASQVGKTLALADSLSGEAIRTTKTLVTDDTETDERVNRKATRAYDVRSSVCVPLKRGDELLGVLSVSSTRSRAFSTHDVELLGKLAGFISAAVGAASDFTAATARLLDDPRTAEAPAGRFIAGVLDPEGAHAVAVHTDVERILRAREFSLAFQPIFELRGGKVFAVEALARFDDGRAPNVVIDAAHEVGLGVELELAIAQTALTHRAQLPHNAALAINAGPDALSSNGIAELIEAVDPAHVIIELTEHVGVDDYRHMIDALRAHRCTGLRLAIDDAGAGFASLMHILKLAPDFIKLDRELMNGIDIDPVRRSLASTLMRFAAETGAQIVAEGVETAGELATLQTLGVDYAQGFFLARPGTIGALRRASAQGTARVRCSHTNSTAGHSAAHLTRTALR
jgi:EAL domain-containing protein (putative c-di-GMP-specific phosphodiesterase class I)